MDNYEAIEIGGSATKCELTILTPSLLAISNIFKK